jgi:hypothetical protein
MDCKKGYGEFLNSLTSKNVIGDNLIRSKPLKLIRCVDCVILVDFRHCTLSKKEIYLNISQTLYSANGAFKNISVELKSDGL